MNIFHSLHVEKFNFNLNKYSSIFFLQFGEIHFLDTNSFAEVGLHLQLHQLLWKVKMLTAVRTRCGGQIHLAIVTNTICYLDKYILRKLKCKAWTGLHPHQSLSKVKMHIAQAQGSVVWSWPEVLNSWSQNKFTNTQIHKHSSLGLFVYTCICICICSRT